MIKGSEGHLEIQNIELESTEKVLNFLLGSAKRYSSLLIIDSKIKAEEFEKSNFSFLSESVPDLKLEKITVKCTEFIENSLSVFVKCADLLQVKQIRIPESNSPLPDPNELSIKICLLYTSPSPRDQRGSRMPSSA